MNTSNLGKWRIFGDDIVRQSDLSKEIRGSVCEVLQISQPFTTFYMWRTWKISRKSNSWLQFTLDEFIAFLLSLPKWANETPGLRQIFEYLVGVHLESFTYTTELKKLKAGYLIDKILQHFYKKIDSTLHPDRNLWIYSAHDVTLAILLNALDMFDVIHLDVHWQFFLGKFSFSWNLQSKVPPYASSLHFELYKSGREYYVQIIYRKPDTDYNPQPLYIRNCGTMCPLDKFFDFYRHILPRKNESFASACKIRK